MAGSVNSTPREADPAAAYESWNFERTTLAVSFRGAVFQRVESGHETAPTMSRCRLERHEHDQRVHRIGKREAVQ